MVNIFIMSRVLIIFSTHPSMTAVCLISRKAPVFPSLNRAFSSAPRSPYSPRLWPYQVSCIKLEPPEKLRSREAEKGGNTADSPHFIKLVLIGWIRRFLSMIPRIQTAQD